MGEHKHKQAAAQPEPQSQEALITPELERELMALKDRVQREYAGETPADEYVGRTPGQIEEAEALQDAAARPPDTSSAAEARIASLESQLRETNELVKKLANERGGYNAAAREVLALQTEKERRRIYDRINLNGGRCTVVVHTHEDPAQNWPVPVCINGHRILIKRGEPTIITASHLEVLDHAKVEAWVKEVDQDGNPHMVRHERLSYPYSLLDYSGQRLERH